MEPEGSLKCWEEKTERGKTVSFRPNSYFLQRFVHGSSSSLYPHSAYYFHLRIGTAHSSKMPVNIQNWDKMSHSLEKVKHFGGICHFPLHGQRVGHESCLLSPLPLDSYPSYTSAMEMKLTCSSDKSVTCLKIYFIINTAVRT
jgi:hypothetical protein